MAIKFETKLTEKTFSSKSNASRAAKDAVKKGDLEASEYSVKEVDGKWRIILRAGAVSEQVEAPAIPAFTPEETDKVIEYFENGFGVSEDGVEPEGIEDDIEGTEDESEFDEEGWEAEQAAPAEAPKNDLDAALATILQSKATLNAKSNEAKAKLLAGDPILRGACEVYQALSDVQREQFASILGMKRGHKANGSAKVYKATTKVAKIELDPDLVVRAVDIFGVAHPRASHVDQIKAAMAGTYPEEPNLESKYYQLDKKKHLGDIQAAIADKDAEKLRIITQGISLNRYSGALLRTYARLAALAVDVEVAAQ